MTCKTELLNILDSSVSQGQFPSWDFNEDYHFVGAMRVSGFTMDSEVGLVFEYVEYSVMECAIQCVARCFATFSVAKQLVVGDAIFTRCEDLIDPNTGEFLVGLDVIQATSRGREFSISLEKARLIADKYLAPQADFIIPQSVLFQVCDSVPTDWLFCEPSYLIKAFEMGETAKRLFCLEEWQHLSLEEVYADMVKPSSSPDLVAIVDAVCTGNSSPELVGTRNTLWRAQITKG